MSETRVKAFELNIGDLVKLDDGSFQEIIDLQLTNGNWHVAVFLEELELPIDVDMGKTVVIAERV